jgi:hypothetical protein
VSRRRRIRICKFDYPSASSAISGIAARGKLGISYTAHPQGNDDLAKRDHTARLAKATSGYFYFKSGEAADWISRTVNVPTVNSLTLPDWMAEFDRLKKVNAENHGRQGRQDGAAAESNQS